MIWHPASTRTPFPAVGEIPGSPVFSPRVRG